MKKFLCLLLVVLMVAIPLVACADDPGDQNDPNNPGNNNPADTGDSGENQKDVLELPENVSIYKGKTVTMLYDIKQDYGFYTQDFEEDSDDAYAHGIYLRNDAVEQKLGVELEGKEINDGGAAGVKKVFDLDVSSNSNSYGLIFNSVQQMSASVAAGNVLAYEHLPWVKLDKSWWNKDCHEQLALGGKSYMNSGDIMVSDKDVMWALYVLKDRLKEHTNFPDPFALAKEGKWTWDVMYSMASDVAFDSNSDDQMTINSSDIFGLCTHPENYAASWQSAGLKLVSLDKQGMPSLTWGSEKFYTVFEDIKVIMGDSMVVSPTDIGWISTAITSNKTLFGTEVIAFVRKYRASDYDFGILPYPKYDESVERYNTYIAINSAVVSVGLTQPEAELMSVVLETMAACGQEKLIPIYYEEQLKGRYSVDEDSSDMLDIIFEYRCYDLGVFFDFGGSGNLNSTSANPQTIWNKSQRNLNKQMDKTLSKILGS